MRLLKQTTATVLVLLFAVIVNCNKEPLLTDLGTRKLVVILKGTYESNNPMPWSMPAINSADYLTYMQDDSVYICNSTADVLPSAFMIDIAEMRLLDSRGSSYKFSNYRQTFAFGLNDIDPFFNGAGYPLTNDDVPSKAYPAIGLYIRKMLLDGAQRYVSKEEGWAPSTVWDVYKEGEYPTYNFNGLQIHSYFDTLRLESTSLNRVYPLLIPINDIMTGGTGMFYSSSFTYTVLEIRIVVKNYIKKYEQKSTSLTNFGVIHFHALSDFVNDVERDDTVIGGNVIAIARTYIPELVGKISGSTTPGRHVIAIPSTTKLSSYSLNVDPYTDPAEATPKTPADGTLRSLNPCNLPKTPGVYSGTSILQALDYFLKSENNKFLWNKKVPGSGTPSTDVCNSYEVYTAQWNKYAKESGFTIPQLAVYVPASANPTEPFIIENVMPGTYEVYVANKAPVYGQLYYDFNAAAPAEGFTRIGTATVSPGSTVTPVP
jgi:hypothetical protein